MRFLVDVNASGALSRWLLEMGHDVAQVAEQDPRMRDEDLLFVVVKEPVNFLHPRFTKEMSQPGR